MNKEKLLSKIQEQLTGVSYDIFDIATNKKYKSLHNDYDLIEMFAQLNTIYHLIDIVKENERSEQNELR